MEIKKAQVADLDEHFLLLQSLTDATFKKVCVDSGAGESVCPISAFPSYRLHTTAKTGCRHVAAGGQRLTNVGEERTKFQSGGALGSMAL